MGTLVFEPLIAPALWLALAVGAAALLTWYGLWRPGGLSLRVWTGVLMLMATAVTVILVVLLNPTWIEPLSPPQGLPRLTILIDESASMATCDSAGASRFQLAADLARRYADQLKAKFDVRTAAFADTVTPTSVESLSGKTPHANSTDLAAAIAGSL